jgi:hypothetical protein
MSTPELRTLRSGFYLTTSPSYVGSVEGDVARHVSPGLYRVVLYAEVGNPRQRVQVDDIEFDEVATPDDLPQIEVDYLTQLLVARMDKHNEEANSGAVKYPVKFLRRRKNQPPKDTWSFITRDVAALRQQENDGMPPMDLHVDPDRMLMGQNAGAFAELRMVVSDMRLDRAEHRSDMAQSWDIIRELLGKVAELSTKHLEHQEHQAKVNEAGWEALHTGIDMQKRVTGELDSLRRELEIAKMKLIAAEHELKAAGREQFIDAVGPVAAGQAAKMLEQKGKGGFLSNALKMLAMASGMPGLPGMPGAPMPLPTPQPRPQPQPQPQPQPAQTAPAQAPSNGAQVQMPQVDIVEICTAEELNTQPLMCIGRMLGASLGRHQLTAIESVLTSEEWTNFKNLLGASNDTIVFGSAFALYGSLIKDDARQQKLAEALNEFQQNLLNMVADRIAGQVKGPLDPAGLSTKPVDEKKLLAQAMDQNRRMAARLEELEAQVQAQQASAQPQEESTGEEESDPESDAPPQDPEPDPPKVGKKKPSRRGAEA